ncbi:hypothetical protein JCM19037_1159 [Geomicrobium sp. JCM 19037]|nr:hypothetical protein JCM19037_1159 [Geomicrobium sp. JCM 19037]
MVRFLFYDVYIVEDPPIETRNCTNVYFFGLSSNIYSLSDILVLTCSDDSTTTPHHGILSLNEHSSYVILTLSHTKSRRRKAGDHLLFPFVLQSVGMSD